MPISHIETRTYELLVVCVMVYNIVGSVSFRRVLIEVRLRIAGRQWHHRESPLLGTSSLLSVMNLFMGLVSDSLTTNVADTVGVAKR